ncbi:MAG: DUF2188 domain-containing protein [Bacilli bacterium]|nr:DUF2188 domain-containing protein [Bacilli bacterium]
MEKYHVTKHSDGSWQVLLGTGSKKAIKKFKTQKEALEYAESLASNRESTVYLHGRNGKVRDTTSFKPVEEGVKKPGRPRKVKEVTENVTEEVKESTEEQLVVESVKEQPVVEPVKEEVKEEPKKVEKVVPEKKEEAVEPKVEDTNTKPKKKSYVWLIILILVVVVLVVLGIVFKDTITSWFK